MASNDLKLVVNLLKRNKEKHINGFIKGLLKAGLHLQKLSQEIVPVEHGHLKSSAYTELNESTKEVEIGYTAPYSIYVHENPDAAHGKDYNKKHAIEIAAGRDFARGDNQVFKFLEKPYRENHDLLMSIITEEVTKV